MPQAINPAHNTKDKITADTLETICLLTIRHLQMSLIHGPVFYNMQNTHAKLKVQPFSLSSFSLELITDKSF